MAKDIQAFYVTGRTLYALIWNASGNVWDTVAEAFVEYAAASRADYAVTVTEQGSSGASGFYAGTVPAGITTVGFYNAAVYDQIGVSPDESDALVWTDEIVWDGSAQTPPTTGTVSVNFNSPLMTVDPQLRLVDSNGNQVTTLSVAQAIATIFVNMLGDRSGVDSRIITAAVPGIADCIVVAERTSVSQIAMTITVPAVS